MQKFNSFADLANARMELADTRSEVTAEYDGAFGEQSDMAKLSVVDEPMAAEMPDIEVEHLQTPTTTSELGAKGVGEPGLVPTAAAIGNAFFSATGRQLKALPFIPEKVLAALGGDG